MAVVGQLGHKVLCNIANLVQHGVSQANGEIAHCQQARPPSRLSLNFLHSNDSPAHVGKHNMEAMDVRLRIAIKGENFIYSKYLCPAIKFLLFLKILEPPVRHSRRCVMSADM